MILKKPYAFLIKNFKLIHLILTTIYILLAIKTSQMLSYYNEYISTQTGKLKAINYINNFYIVYIMLSLIICIIIYILMKHKKKPKTLYTILILIYIITGVVISQCTKGLNDIYFSNITMQSLRIYRDLLRIMLIIQYLTISITLIRGLGFDIKKFNFVKDLNELNVEMTDNEEIELSLGNNNEIKRKTRRKLREYIYYYKENKKFIFIIIIVIMIILSMTITVDKKVINKTYNEKEVFKTDNYSFYVENSYITTKNKKNQTISNDKIYVLVKLNINPINRGIINSDNFILKTKNNNYKVYKKDNNNFNDIAPSYNGQPIISNKTYLFVFELPIDEMQTNKQLIYGEKNKVNLKTINLDVISNSKNYKLNETMNLNNSILNEGEIKITNYNISNNFKENYSYLINNETHTGNINISSTSNTILKLDIQNSLINTDVFQLINIYGNIKYKINKEEYTSKLKINKTPTTYKNGLYIEVDKNIENADSIYIELIIRNSKYTYVVK